MKPEKLKVIAEGMGDTDAWIQKGKWVMTRAKGGVVEYNPLTNAEQLLEIQLKMMALGWYFGKDGNEYTAITPTVDDIIVYRYKSFQNLICDLAFKHFSEVE